MHGVVCRARRLGRVLVLASLLVGPLSQLPAAAQDTNPAVAGQWSSVLNWPDNAIHLQLLPNGKVMFNSREYADYVWDPATGSLGTLAINAYAVFCSGHTILGDGRILFAGGPIGASYASIYDPFTNSWLRLPDLNASRWYPSCVTLSDGSALVISGSINDQMTLNDLPQVWQNNGTWRNLTGARLTVPLYPNLFLAPNGKIFLAGPGTITRYLDTNGTGAWSTVAKSLRHPRLWPRRPLRHRQGAPGGRRRSAGGVRGGH